jgi:hypothetical protein
MATRLTLRQALLPVIDRLRGLPDSLGLRLYAVQIVVRTWSGSRAGLGGNTDTATGLKVDLGVHNIKVVQVTQQDVIASGGLYSNQDLKVGPITPPFPGSAKDDDAIAIWDPVPVLGAPGAEVFFFITGPGMLGGAWFKKVGQNVTKNFRYEFTVRRTAEIP